MNTLNSQARRTTADPDIIASMKAREITQFDRQHGWEHSEEYLGLVVLPVVILILLLVLTRRTSIL